MRRILDLFCGAGGCSIGYERAGWTPFGVDTDANALKRYPYPSMHANAMAVLAGDVPQIRLDDFDAIHASPPCQAYSITRHTHDKEHPDLLPAVLAALLAWGERTGRPWVVENVPGASFPVGTWVVELCGAQHRAHDPATGRTVRLRRHRLFATNRPVLAEPCSCDGTTVAGVYTGAGRDFEYMRNVRKGGYVPAPAVQQALMTMTHMTNKQLAQAIPPSYTQLLGEQI